MASRAAGDMECSAVKRREGKAAMATPLVKNRFASVDRAKKEERGIKEKELGGKTMMRWPPWRRTVSRSMRGWVSGKMPILVMARLSVSAMRTAAAASAQARSIPAAVYSGLKTPDS